MTWELKNMFAGVVAATSRAIAASFEMGGSRTGEP